MRTNELSFKTLQDIIHVTSGYIVVVELEDPTSTDSESVQLITDPKKLKNNTFSSSIKNGDVTYLHIRV